MRKIREIWDQLSAIDRAVFILGTLWFFTAIATGFIWKDQLWAVLLELGCLLGLITLMLIQIFQKKDLTKPKRIGFTFRAAAFLCITSADLLPRIGWITFAEEIYLPLKWFGLIALVGSFYLEELFAEEKTNSEQMK
ncbi:MAG: hypothetical protein Q4G00_02780 [Clostridia bacterium]|nr:hypothetical protein [Clostridia bacterium]